MRVWRWKLRGAAFGRAPYAAEVHGHFPGKVDWHEPLCPRSTTARKKRDTYRVALAAHDTYGATRLGRERLQ